MAVYWLEQNDQDVPAENDWLSASETVRLQGMRFAKRRADWRLGRWTAKRALACCLGLISDSHTLAQIEICPASSGAPEVFIARRKQMLNLSLSHCSGRALCALTLSGTSLGCDLELAEARHEAFLTDYFTFDEQDCVRTAPPSARWRVLALLWSSKESALKALQMGLRLDTRLALVSFPDTQLSDDFWRPLQVSCPNETLFVGWHSAKGDFVRTVVTAPPLELLIELKLPPYGPRSGRSRSVKPFAEMPMVR